MPAQNPDLHGNVPDEAPVALVIIDVINDLEFPGGDRLLRHALRMADRLAALKRRAKAAGIPVIYANDNFGRAFMRDFHLVVPGDCVASIEVKDNRRALAHMR